MNVFSTRMQHCPVNCQHSLVGVGVIRIYVYVCILLFSLEDNQKDADLHCLTSVEQTHTVSVSPCTADRMGDLVIILDI